MTASPARFADARRRPRWALIALVALGHLAVFYGLVRAFAPDAVNSVGRSVLATFNVTIAAPPPPPPAAAEPEPEEGAQGDPGRKAVPRAVTAPVPRVPIPRPSPAPRASSTGAANTSGATESGAGTGAAGSGEGTGSGRGGAGQGGGGAMVSKAVKIAGDINSAADFPVPPGGRQARFGTSVTVAMTVGTDGRASGCRVVRPSPDREADAIVCRLAEQRFRFRPATDGEGNPVAATFGWRQDWFAR